MTVPDYRLLNQQRTQMMRAFLGINHDDKRTLGRNRNEVWVRHAVFLPTRHPDFIRLKWHRVVKRADRFDNHACNVAGVSARSSCIRGPRALLPGERRIDTTTIPTAKRRVGPMQDPLYRKNVAHQTMGYVYPPQLSYHFR